MDKELLVRIESVYGNRLIYPINNSAILLAKLMGRKTFSRDHVKDFQKLGFQVEIERESL
jgi:hypothetical protein